MEELDSRPAKVTIDATADGPAAMVVRIGGELDMASIPEVDLELEPIIRAAPERLVFDLSGVTFMDSSGIAMLLRTSAKVAFVQVRDPSPPVLLVLQATGLCEVLHIDR